MWSATTHGDGYTIEYRDESIQISVLIEKPKDIESKRRLMLAAVELIKSGSISVNSHASVSLPPVSFR